MSTRVVLLLCCALFAWQVQAVTPIEKVVSLLKKLSTQIAEEGKKEAAEYDKYSCFCKEQADDKLYAIERSTEKIATLKAKKEMLTTDISALNQDISDLGTKITNYGTDIKTATDKRAVEFTDYKKKAQDLTDAVSACERAVEAMTEAKSDIAENDGKVDLMQLSAASPLFQASLLAVVATKQNPASYQYSTNEVISTLNDLLARFKRNKAELDETEMNAVSAHELKVQDMSNQKTFAEKEKFEKEENVESMSETLADTTEEKDSETSAKTADDEFMKVLTSECEQKAKDWDQRSTTRSGELAAIETAVEDLEKNAMGNYKANTKLNDLQTKQIVKVAARSTSAALSFLQVRTPTKASLLATGASRIAATQRVLDLLLKKSGQSNSPVLASVSMKLTLLQQSGIDHFVKVRQIIKDLIGKLDADAKGEATTKSYCDKNLKKQTETRDAAKLTIEEKSAGITTSQAELGETKQALAELAAGIAKNMKALNEATELRNDAKAKNDASIAMSQEGKTSIDFALKILQKFYSDAKLIQKATYTPPNADRSGKTVSDMAPEAFSGKYHGNQDASKGIIGILEVIQADFARTEEQVKKDEADSEAAYQEFKKTTDEDTAAKNKETTEKEKRESDLKDKIVSLTDDKKDAEANLESAMTTLEDLKKMCIDGEETYSERVAKRQEEIEALKEALSIFENWKN